MRRWTAKRETIWEIFALSIGIEDVSILTEIPEQSAVAQEAWETMFQVFMVEAKLSETAISPHLVKFQNLLHIPAIQLVNQKNIARKIRNGTDTILVASAANWLSCLN